MKKTRMIWFTLLVIVIAGTVFAFRQQTSNQSGLLSKLWSYDWQERANAVEKLSANREALESDEVKRDLLDLLERENQVIVSAYNEGEPVSIKYGEGYSEYYSKLLGIVNEVANFNDAHTLEILARASYNPDSPFAMKLARYGEAVVPILFELAKSDFAPYKENAIAILGEILKRDKNLSPRMSAENHEQIKQALVKGTSDKEFWVRKQAVRALGKVGDKDLIPLLENISLNDPATVPAGERDVNYPVRIEAHKALSAIRKKTGGRPM